MYKKIQLICISGLGGHMTTNHMLLTVLLFYSTYLDHVIITVSMFGIAYFI